MSVTIGEALRFGIEKLRVSGDSPRADAYRLLENFVDCNSAWLIANQHEALSESARRCFVAAVERRRSGEPVAYITGRSGFFGASYDVNADVLVPRPETEHLVEAALEFLRPRSNVGVLDIGTGSGVIACAIALGLSNVRVDAVDVSGAAIATAKKNAGRLGIAGRCRFLIGDLLAPVKGKRYSCIVANLPYIPTPQLPRRPNSAAFEPKAALDGGPDGLKLYRRLLPQLRDFLEADSLVLLEAAPPALDRLFALAREQFPQARCSVHRDYANIDRFITIATGSAAIGAE
ncbi:MAG: peptide chain release factor N(5)-glutamine methyltransferase [Candidatus Eremiobacteraeota bacterium]|nr:peptide chain release factor N(5)-glutamine methyltransferase [Candidatus Eremiobacteraeota bacterium]